MLHRRQLLTLLASAAGAPLKSENSQVVETQFGKVQGESRKGVHVFRGIPYGAPTEGAGRFMAPAKPAHWMSTRDCSQTGPRCVQGAGNIFLSPTIGEYFRGSAGRAELAPQPDSENCLVLNVLTPGLRGKRPVMVYIHGGGFTGGSSHLTVFADAFPRENDVVLVGVNHRINVFGYLHLGLTNPKFATNVGQLDLIAALEWVRDNIAQFGGDPSNVTIFGESGGGAKISALAAMPDAKGLYHKAIIESGSQLSVLTRETATEQVKQVLGKLNVSETGLRDVPAVELHKAVMALTPPLQFGPVVDGSHIPSQTWERGAPKFLAGIPMIIGACKDETTLFQLRDARLFSLDAAGLRAEFIKAGATALDADKLVAAYSREHPKDSPSDIYFRFATDRAVRWNSIRQAELKAEQAKGDVYMYHFAWDTPCAEGKIRAFHTAELPLAMRLVRYPESENLSRQIAEAWAAFARHGNPNGAKLPRWPRFKLEQRATMVYDATEGRVVNDPDGAARLIVNKLPNLGRS